MSKSNKKETIDGTELVSNIVSEHLEAEKLFNTSVEQLQNIVRTRNKEKFAQDFGSSEKLISCLRSNSVSGIKQADVQQRQNLFGINKIEPPPPTPFWKLMLEAVKDTTILILIVSAVVSLILTTTVIPPSELEWMDSVAILVAVVVVVMVASTNDYSKEKQFRKLNAKKDEKYINVIRDGKQQSTSIYNVVVGDIIVLGVGNQIAADGFLISSSDLKVDESGMTGESEEVKKSVEKDPFLIGSCLVKSGSGLYVVTAVGKNSIYGDIMLTLQEEDEDTPLQSKLDELAKIIGYVGMGAAAITFLALILNFFFGKQHDITDPKSYVVWVNYFILAITIIVVAVPEGLPLAVVISLAYSIKQMLKDQCLVRKLESCETMGSASNICSDKTGTLTLNQMRVVNTQFCNLNIKSDSKQSLSSQIKQNVNNNTIKYLSLVSNLCSSAEVKENNGNYQVLGNSTEGALLILSKELGNDYSIYRQALIVDHKLDGAIIKKIDFSSDRKKMTTVLNLKKFQSNFKCEMNGNILVLTKGASEIMLERCSQIMDENGQIQKLSQTIKQNITQQILKFAENSLRTLILAFREINEGDSLEEDNIESDLTMICLVGIQDPLRPAVKQAIADCKHAQITVRMVTGDNLITAVAIAKDAGILPPEMTVEKALFEKKAIQGPDFQKLNDQEVDAMLPTLVCMARSAPKDKYRLVCRLKQNNYVVAATGDGSNDAPQLNAANVGLAMGIAGTEVAKEASAMIIMDDAFDTIVKAIRWGRTVMANVRKFLQFQLSVNVVALLIAFLGCTFLQSSPLTAIQLLWVNLIMDSLGSLALATEGINKNVLDCPPVHRSASMITPGMLRNIIIVAAYESIIILLMMFEGVGDSFTIVPQSLFVQYSTSAINNQLKNLRQIWRYTVVYNFFIFVQIFNEFNSRRINGELNVFEGVFKNMMFICVIAGTIIFQLIIMLVPGIRDVFSVYSCAKDSISHCNYTPGDNTSIPNFPIPPDIPDTIGWEAWLLSIGCAAGVFVVHFIGRLFVGKLPLEFKVSEKRIQKDLEKLRKREEEKEKKEAEEMEEKKKKFSQIK